MTDRELLELAAKAVGAKLLLSAFDAAVWMLNDIPWNPLTDDGDALRLAVKIGRSRTLQLVVGVGGADCQFDHPLVTAFESGDDPYAATRRAIVRAAAEIGRTM